MLTAALVIGLPLLVLWLIVNGHLVGYSQLGSRRRRKGKDG